MGALQAMLLMGSSGSAPSDLAANAIVEGGSVPVSVNTASGSTASLPGGGFRDMRVGVSGGTPPYTFEWNRQNGANKTALTSTSGSTTYVSWSNMSVGDYYSTTANCTVRDSATPRNSVTTPTVVIGIQRSN